VAIVLTGDSGELVGFDERLRARGSCSRLPRTISGPASACSGVVEVAAAKAILRVPAGPCPGAASIPVGRYGTPAEYSAAILFLASAPASFITGTQLRVDGGMIPSI
jgi:NAD(P)-dependent dehydrogenase (short-subunit alcohol dehydrogenase family)